jgi:hypothetical protein
MEGGFGRVRLQHGSCELNMDRTSCCFWFSVSGSVCRFWSCPGEDQGVKTRETCVRFSPRADAGRGCFPKLKTVAVAWCTGVGYCASEQREMKWLDSVKNDVMFCSLSEMKGERWHVLGGDDGGCRMCGLSCGMHGCSFKSRMAARVQGLGMEGFWKCGGLRFPQPCLVLGTTYPGTSLHLEFP